MSIYINKNNQQTGPFDDAKVLEMLGNGELLPNDLAIRHGENEWRNLGFYFPNVGNVAPALAQTAPSAPKKSGKKLFGCAGFFLVFLVIASILGILAFRNKFPAQNEEDLPETVKAGAFEYKLKSRNRGDGDIWGTKKTFAAIYDEKDYPNDYEKAMICVLTVYEDENAAKLGLEDEIREFCKGDKAMRFSFLDANKNELSKGATCGIPLFVLKDNKVYSIGSISRDATKVVDASTAFAENLPFNQGSKMTRTSYK